MSSNIKVTKKKEHSQASRVLYRDDQIAFLRTILETAAKFDTLEMPSPAIFVSGPPGSGKNTVIQFVISETGTETIYVDCNQETSSRIAEQLLQKFAELLDDRSLADVRRPSFQDLLRLSRENQ